MITEINELRGLDMALLLNRFARNRSFLTDAVLGLGGEIQLVVFQNKPQKDNYLEITIELDQLFNVTRYDRNNDDRWEILWDREVVSLEDVKSEIDAFCRELC